MPEPLSYKTHRAYDSVYHFFVVPILGINVLLDAYIVFRHPVLLNVWTLIVAIALVALTWRVRSFPLRVQDRLIRLEETLRLQSVLPEELRGRVGEISTRELIALRFCTDDELPEHVRAIYAGDYRGGENVKSHIKIWRPDPHRI